MGTSETTAESASGERRIERGMLLAVLLAGSLAMARDLADADLWGHVTFGAEVLATGRLPATTTHSFTADGYRWINHENLSELALAGLALAGGGAALLLAKCLLGFGVLAAIARAAVRNGASIMTACLMVMLVAVNLSATWTLRPQLFSYVLFAAMIVCLNRAFADYVPRGKIQVGWLWTVVVLLFFWANTHGGFVAGLLMFAVYMAGRSTEALVRFGLPAWKGVWRFTLITAAGGLATLVNPYGPHLHRWLIDSLGQPRPEITEWASVSFGDPALWPLAALLLITGVSLALTRRRRDATQLVLLAITAWQSIEHIRHVPFFAILAGFWLPPHIDSAWQRLAARLRRAERGPKEDRQPAGARLLLGGLTVACLILAFVLVGRLRDVRVDKTEFPVDAIAFMAENDLHGRLVVTYNWAQYALAALAPQTTVAFDGRFRTCYPQEIVDMHFDFVLGQIPHRRHRSGRSGPVDPWRVLDQGQPDLVLVDRSQRGSVAAIAARDDWVLLYQDGIAAVWGRRARFDRPGHHDYLPPDRRTISGVMPAGFARWPALPRASGGLIQAASRPRHDDVVN